MTGAVPACEAGWCPSWFIAACINMQPHMATSLQGLPTMWTNFPVILRRRIAAWADAACGGPESFEKVVARDGVDDYSN